MAGEGASSSSSHPGERLKNLPWLARPRERSSVVLADPRVHSEVTHVRVHAPGHAPAHASKQEREGWQAPASSGLKATAHPGGRRYVAPERQPAAAPAWAAHEACLCRFGGRQEEQTKHGLKWQVEAQRMRGTRRGSRRFRARPSSAPQQAGQAAKPSGRPRKAWRSIKPSGSRTRGRSAAAACGHTEATPDFPFGCQPAAPTAGTAL